MTRQLKIKVCGIKYTTNREAVEKLAVDWLGFIFYRQSTRFVGDDPERFLFDGEKPKVGVFVDENAFEILSLSRKFGFQYVQLHGKENPKTCHILKQQGLKIIKAFSVEENFDFLKTAPFEKVANYFLFDTKSGLPGGSGQKFNWNILEKYDGHTPFFLSGGIGPGDAETIMKFNHPKLTGVDINSGFEDTPGVKNVEKLSQFIHKLKQT